MPCKLLINPSKLILRRGNEPLQHYHHPRMLTGVMQGMRDRALRICDNTSKQPEMEHLARVFKANGFPEKLVRKSLSKPRRQQIRGQPPEEEEPLKMLHIPYVWGLSEKIEMSCALLAVTAVFKPQSTLKQKLVKVKQKIPEEKCSSRFPARIAVRYTLERPKEH